MLHICPFCRCEVVDGERCPECSAKFLASEWYDKAVVPDGRNRSADGHYRFPPADHPVRGELSKPHTQELPPPAIGYRVSVGGQKQHIAIAEVDAPLAEFYRHLIPDGDEWWVIRRNAAAEVVLNGKYEVDNCRLEEGDIVTVAGVPILFTGTSLIAGYSERAEMFFEIKGLTVTKNGKTILNDIDFHIRSGEFIGILGPSGCGKSSLIQQIVGLGHSDSGSILVNGGPYAKSVDAIRQLTAYMPQTVALHNELSLREELKCFSLLHGTSPYDAEAKLALVGMRQETAKRIGALSGGQQRRVGIALELLREPQLLVLDEPTAGLDPASETQVMKYLRRLADQGKGVLCATHIMENLDKFDKVLVLSKGYNVFFGTPRDLLARFDISRPVELYDLLGAGSENRQIERAEKLAMSFRDSRKGEAAEEKQSPLPRCRRGASPIKQYWGYLLRQAMEFLSFRHAAHPFWAFLTSACFIQLLLQPILIALSLRLCCAHLFYGSHTAQLFDLCFFSCLAVFWFGLNNAVRELVRERVPWRCLERLEGVSMIGYIGAKLSWTALLALIQTALLYLLLFVVEPASLIAKDAAGINLVFPGIVFLVLYGVCLSGAWIGLGISAIFTKENAAVAMLPNILVPVLFFSGTIIGDVKNNNANMYNKTASIIEKWMPCFAPAKYMERHINSRNDEADKSRKENKKIDYPLAKVNVGTVLIFLAILAAGQYALEKKWEGR